MVPREFGFHLEKQFYSTIVFPTDGANTNPFSKKPSPTHKPSPTLSELVNLKLHHKGRMQSKLKQQEDIDDGEQELFFNKTQSLGELIREKSKTQKSSVQLLSMTAPYKKCDAL